MKEEQLNKFTNVVASTVLKQEYLDESVISTFKFNLALLLSKLGKQPCIRLSMKDGQYLKLLNECNIEYEYVDFNWTVNITSKGIAFIYHDINGKNKKQE